MKREAVVLCLCLCLVATCGCGLIKKGRSSTALPTATIAASPAISPWSTPIAQMPKDDVRVQTDSGTYEGLADNNFFEVKIIGKPEENASQVFMITDKIRAKFENLALKKDEQVLISYTKNQFGQLVVEEIARIKK